MPKQVKLPDGSIGNFPDDMDWNQIESVVQRQYPPIEKNNNTVNTFLGPLPSNVPELMPGTPENKSMMNEMIGFAIPAEAAIGEFRELGQGKNILSKLYQSAKNVISNKTLAKSILKTHDALEQSASQGFKTVSDEVNKRGITTVPINDNAIEKLREFFPRTKQANALLERGKMGDYNALRNLQSDLYTKGKNSLKSPLESERMRADEMFENRNEINQAISDHLRSSGHDDLNEILNKAISEYRTLQDIYYNTNMNNAIVKMVDSDIRKIPKNLSTVLKEQSKPMNKLLDFHPDLESNLNKYLVTKNVLSTIKKNLSPLGIGALGGAIGAGTLAYRNSRNE